MNCRRVRSQLSAYVDNELTGYEMLALRDHLSNCRECRDEHYSLKTMKYLLRALPDKDPNPEWVALLAESFSRPAPTLTQRLLLYWERSLEVAMSVFVSRDGQEGTLVFNRRLASALMLSAVGVLLIATSFDQNPVKVAPSSGYANPSGAQQAGVFPFVKVNNGSAISPAAARPGEYYLIPIPLPPPSLQGSASNLIPQSPTRMPVPSSDRENYLTSINMHVIPPPGGMNSFGGPWSGARLASPSFGH